MLIREKVLEFSVRLFRFSFGIFEKPELKRFLHMGLIFAFITGIGATLLPLKDSILIQLAGTSHLPYAKIFSIFSLIPSLIFYTKLLEKVPRKKMLLMLPALAGISIIGFGLIMQFAQNSPEIIAARPLIPYLGTKILGYLWYIFVESYGYFLVSLFWAFAANITGFHSAKKGFPLVAAIGQIGGAICPYLIGGIPHHFGFSTDMISILIIAALSLILVPLIQQFLKHIPPLDLIPSKDPDTLSEQSPSCSLVPISIKSVLSHRYLICIFIVNLSRETIVRILEFNFKLAAGSQYTGVELSNYLSLYISAVNIASFLALALGISRIPRILGLGIALMITPILMGCFLYGFINTNTLPFLFLLIVGSEALDLSLNGPTLRQLYIPTTDITRFKSQAWIEILGPASSPGPFLNMLLSPLKCLFGEVLGRDYYLTLVTVIGFPLIALWTGLTLYLGKIFHKAVKSKQTIC